MDISRDVTIRAKMEVVKTDLKAPDTKPFFDETQKATDAVHRQKDAIVDAAQAEREAAQTFSDAEQQKQLEADNTTDAINREREAAKQLTDELLKAGEGFRTAGDGAFTLVRGLALVGIEGEDSLNKVLVQVAQIQAKFDIFRGSLDVVKGGVEGFRGLGAAISSSRGNMAELLDEMDDMAGVLSPQGIILAGILLMGKFAYDAWQIWQVEQKKAFDQTEEGLAIIAAKEQELAESRRRRESGINLDANVESLNAQIDLARNTGVSQEGITKLIQQRDKAEQASFKQQIAATFEEAQSLNVEDEDFVEQNNAIVERRNQLIIEQQRNRRERTLARAGRAADVAGDQRDSARELIGERSELQSELQGVTETANDISLLDTDEQRKAIERREEITQRLAEIAEENPDEQLAEALARILEVQQKSNEIIRQTTRGVRDAQVQLGFLEEAVE